MKLNQLRQIIREEVRRVIAEAKVLHIINPNMGILLFLQIKQQFL